MKTFEKRRICILFMMIVAALATSCQKMIEKEANKLDRIDLTIDIDGKRTEMMSVGFTYFPPANAKRELQIPFVKGASLLTADALVITIPSFRDGKSIYHAQRKEVIVSYKEDAEAYEDDSQEWLSDDGALEITEFDGENIKGKLNVTLKAVGSSKTKELKNGVFTAQKLL